MCIRDRPRGTRRNKRCLRCPVQPGGTRTLLRDSSRGPRGATTDARAAGRGRGRSDVARG
eukprot:12119637-Alexandrium_andersonii.AAC.1